MPDLDACGRGARKVYNPRKLDDLGWESRTEKENIFISVLKNLDPSKGHRFMETAIEKFPLTLPIVDQTKLKTKLKENQGVLKVPPIKIILPKDKTEQPYVVNVKENSHSEKRSSKRLAKVAMIQEDFSEHPKSVNFSPETKCADGGGRVRKVKLIRYY
jgi:hypothetical protein